MAVIDSDKKEEHNKVKKGVVAVLFLVAFLAVVLFLTLRFAGKGDADIKSKAEEGKRLVESLETKDVAAVERNMRAVESEEEAKAQSVQESSDESRQAEASTDAWNAARTAREERLARLNSGEEPIGPQFANTLILGDSRTEGFTLYGFLDASQIICERGADINSIMANMDTLVNLNPQHLILSYGMNDVIAYSGDAQRFGERYRTILEELKSKLPEAKIAVNSILNVQENAMAKNDAFQYIGAFNEVVKGLCGELGLSYIDNSGICETYAGLYEPDGIHVGKDFYPEWMKMMILDAGL